MNLKFWYILNAKKKILMKRESNRDAFPQGVQDREENEHKPTVLFDLPSKL